MNGFTSLYRHFSADGELLYIGISMSLLHRTAQHKHKAVWFREIARIEVQHFNTMDSALYAEELAIKAEKPKHNIIHANSILPRKYTPELIREKARFRRLIKDFRRDFSEKMRGEA